jgi:hypothetical protein
MTTFIKNTTFAVFLAIFFLIAIPAWAADFPENVNQRGNKAEADRSPDTYSNKEILKNWTLIMCMKQLVNDPKDQENLSNLADSYFKFIQAPKEGFEKLRQMVSKYIALKYQNSIPGDFNIHKCVNLYHSKELERIVSEMDINAKRIPLEQNKK